MSKIELIKKAIEDAENMKSNLSLEVFENVPALVSLKGRHLYNNLGKLATNYMEHGVHLGGSFCSFVFNNSNIAYAIAVDNFASDEVEERKCEPIFKSNANRYLPMPTKFKFIKSNSFDVNKDEIDKLIDVYTFDGDHSEESQKMALTYFYDVLADEFIYICDDYDWTAVQKGTQDAIKELRLEVLFEQHLKGGDHDNDGWWNGYFVALLKKKK